MMNSRAGPPMARCSACEALIPIASTALGSSILPNDPDGRLGSRSCREIQYFLWGIDEQSRASSLWATERRALIHRVCWRPGLCGFAQAAPPLAQAGRDRGGPRIVCPTACLGAARGLAPTSLVRPLGKLALRPLRSGQRSLRRVEHGAVRPLRSGPEPILSGAHAINSNGDALRTSPRLKSSGSTTVGRRPGKGRPRRRAKGPANFGSWHGAVPACRRNLVTQ